jgi:hypothetical protein
MARGAFVSGESGSHGSCEIRRRAVGKEVVPGGLPIRKIRGGVVAVDEIGLVV